MCFSPQADFTAGVVVAGVGVATLRRVRVRRELIVGALPLLFGIHQLVEGFVWLGLRGEVSPGLGDTAKQVYIVFAHAILPALVPLGFTLLEPDRRRARWMWPLVGLGLLLGGYLLWQVTAYPVGAQLQARCIDYSTHTPNDLAGPLYRLQHPHAERPSHRRPLRRRDLRSGADLEPASSALVRGGEPGRRDRRRARAGR
jgi:hypothetical protein